MDYTGLLTNPSTDAPAYVTGVAISPDSVLGIQTGTFDVSFSRPMDQGRDPNLLFDAVLLNHTSIYSPDNSGLMSHVVHGMTVDDDLTLWLATLGGLGKRTASGAWTTYTTGNSGLPADDVLDVDVDSAGNRWVGLRDHGAARFGVDNSWTYYTTANSPLICESVVEVEVDHTDNVWFGCVGAVSVRLANGTWLSYESATSGLNGSQGTRIYVDNDNNKWFAVQGGDWGAGNSGVTRLDPQGNWTSYTTTNSDLPQNSIQGVVQDQAGNMWFGNADYGVSVLSPEGAWTQYPDIYAPRNMAIDAQGNIWILSENMRVVSPDGTWQSFYWPDVGMTASPNGIIAIQPQGGVWLGMAAQVSQPGLAFFHHNGHYPVTGGSEWLSATTWRATSDFTSNFLRDDYALNLTAALGTDGIEIAPDSRFTFTVDYAGTISDQSPPPAPVVFANGVEGDASAVAAMWHSADGESGITQYRYALGTTPGEADILNWTSTPALSAARSGLGLVPGQTYWVSAQARNAGGLWSPVASNAFVAGEEKDLRVFLPLVKR